MDSRLPVFLLSPQRLSLSLSLSLCLSFLLPSWIVHLDASLVAPLSSFWRPASIRILDLSLICHQVVLFPSPLTINTTSRRPCLFVCHRSMAVGEEGPAQSKRTGTFLKGRT